MDAVFKLHNVHWQHPDQFKTLDPHLRGLIGLPLVYRFPLLDALPTRTPGVYSITGGRQVGKTTLLKQYIAELLGRGVPPQNIAYLPGELVDDHHALVRTVGAYLEPIVQDGVPVFLIIDEVTYIKDWDRGIKYMADAGMLRNVVVILTGSDTVVIRDARMRFPGRRGRADRVDFHLFPLSFAEYAGLKMKVAAASLGGREGDETRPGHWAGLESLFETYLENGGYLVAINELDRDGMIGRATFATYADWIRGDVMKRGKQEHYLREILEALLKRMGSQLTWNTLVGELTINHPATVIDYVELLSRMDAVVVQQALREDKLCGAPKKARKVHFADPFIAHAARAWLTNCENPYQEMVKPLLANSAAKSAIVEACAVSHFSRFHPTYYIKGDGEVDIAYVKDGRFWPLEIKWTRQIRAPEIKQAAKYKNSLIAGREGLPAQIHGIPFAPLVKVLLDLGPSPFWLRD